jgi:hypothetical protein
VVGDRRRCSPGARETGETDGGGGPILVARRAAGLRRLAVGAQEEGDSGQGRCTARRRAAVPTAGDATRQRDGLLAAQGCEGGGCAGKRGGKREAERCKTRVTREFIGHAGADVGEKN